MFLLVGLPSMLFPLAHVRLPPERGLLPVHAVSPAQSVAVPSPAQVTGVTVSLSAPTTVSKLGMGVTHTRYSADSYNDPTAVATARYLLRNAFSYQNQHMMGWGAADPEPSPGVYDWESLDQRVQLMRDTKADMVITLCCAPGWMRPQGYQDDWANLEVAPDPTHVQDFADLCKMVALRYPDVKAFQVWNELKGMYTGSPGADPAIANQNRWDYVRYTTLYNAVYDAVKSVRPDAQLGGPYVVMESSGDASQMSNPGPSYSWGTLDQRPLDVITYWLQHKHGADFITVDGDASNTDNVPKVDLFGAAQKFGDILQWIRQQGDGGATLPMWWAEWYAGVPNNMAGSLAYANAAMASGQIDTLLSGASVLLIWGPQGDTQGFSSPEGVWTDTRVETGGQPTPYYGTAQAFNTYFASGTQLYHTTTSSMNLAVLASRAVTMLVNQRSTTQYVSVNGIVILLRPYEVYLLSTSHLSSSRLLRSPPLLPCMSQRGPHFSA
jgi:hypothetical protein